MHVTLSKDYKGLINLVFINARQQANNYPLSNIQIQSSKRTQWKLLLEEEHSRYVFPGETEADICSAGSSARGSRADKNNRKTPEGGEHQNIEQEWQFVVSAPPPPQITVSPGDDCETTGKITQSIPRLFPGISYLRDVGSKKIGALKQKLAASKRSSSDSIVDTEEQQPLLESDKDEDWAEEEEPLIDILEPPSFEPERISSATGPKIIVKNHKHRAFLFALHKYSDTISVHNLNMNPEPLYVYQLPAHCEDVLVTQNVMYTVQMVGRQAKRERRKDSVERTSDDGTEGGGTAAANEAADAELVNACGVISKALSLTTKNRDSVS